MGRPKKRTTETTANEPMKSNGFIDALKFVGAVTKDIGPPNETHVFLNNHWVSAFNGILAAGHKVAEDIYVCPNNKLIIEALSKCGEHLSITQLDNNRLSIKSDKFKAIVPCVDPTIMPLAIPDAPCAVIDDRLKAAIEAVGVLANEDAQTVVAASILLNNGSAIATNRSVIFEYWHGIDLPPGLALPKAVVQPLVKSSKKLARFGFSQSSATFYFEDESWLRTQFYAEPWPDIDAILGQKSNPFPVPADFFKALAAVAPFSGDGHVYFGNGVLYSSPSPDTGASYEVPGLPPGPVYNAKYLALIKPHAEQIDFVARGPGGSHMLMFFGPNIRGAIAGREAYTPKPAITRPNPMDDNIPF